MMLAESGKPVFVINSGRCGSRYCAALLQANGYDAEHEPLRHHGEPVVDLPESTRGRAELRPIVEIECNNYLNDLLDDLADLFLEADYVHLHRAGPPSVTSQVRKSRGDMTKHHEGATTQFEGSCWWWRNSNENHLSHLDKVPNAYSLRFEDLIDGEAAHEFWADLGYPLDETKEVPPENTTPDHVKERFPGPEDWGPHLKATFADICGDTMQKLGYTDDWEEFI